MKRNGPSRKRNDHFVKRNGSNEKRNGPFAKKERKIKMLNKEEIKK